ncbi:uroporphyrinogen decarboxylase [Synchytrium microbalum]|uniref:Uroporphyrinogen decarboxylase n=1 Tax=Synchytrium microbalum TaxID=1806994 RepID=A0A507C6X6_9FUNG|nr:uroporphyrinogen decarboxylase [Synchytrium microbalum]TPX33235.1 uroporphyrinogen decarboxylase [Synchytrium microbalum]
MEQFPELKNDLILRAARGEKTERVPVWIMRQAGRYLPEFRETRATTEFFTVCQTPALATRVTLQPIERFGDLLDAAIIFSDILVIPQALGMECQMLPGVGPHFPAPIRQVSDLEKLNKNVDVNKELGYVFEALTMTRHELKGQCPLFGFAGAPWTCMAYMIEGGGSKNLAKAKGFLYNHPDESHQLLQLITDVTINYLVGQIKAGAQIVQVFDSNAGELSPHVFKKFSLPYLRQISKDVKAKLTAMSIKPVPMIVFAKGAHFALEELTESHYDVVSLDWTLDPSKVRKVTTDKVTLQGNADPILLFADRDTIRAEVKLMLEAFGTQRYIANLGHGMLPDHSPEHLKWYLEAIRDISLEMNAKN